MPDLNEALVDYLLYVGASTGYHLLVLLGPAVLLGYLIHRTSSSLIYSLVERLQLGLSGYVWLFGWLGVAVHELGHALFNLVFGFELQQVRLVYLRPEGGRLGVVVGSRARNLYQQIGLFFIGVGPILLGTGVIYLASRLLLGPETFAPMQRIDVDLSVLTSGNAMELFLTALFGHVREVLASIFTADNFGNWRFWVFVYLAFSVGSAMNLSGSDLRALLMGLAAIAALIFAFNLITAAIGFYPDEVILWLGGVYSSFYAIMAFVLVINTVFALALLLLTLLV